MKELFGLVLSLLGAFILLMKDHTFKLIGEAADLGWIVRGFDALQQGQNSVV